MTYLSGYFSKKTLAKLAKRGIVIRGSVAVGFMYQDTAFELDDNGTHKVRSFGDVLAIAAGGAA